MNKDRMDAFRALAYLCEESNKLQDEKFVKQVLERETQDVYDTLERGNDKLQRM